MKYSLSLAACATVSAAAATTSLLAQMADTHIRRGVEKTYDYTQAVLYLGMEAALALKQNETIADWYQAQVDGVVLDDGTIADWDYSFYSLDEYRMGMSYLYWYNRTGDEKYKSAAEVVREQLNRHPRTPSGGFWHRDPTYPDQMWLDGIFMADSFYSKWTSLYDADNATAWDDIVLQYDNIEAHCRNATSGLLAHGYDESKVAVWADPETGASPHVWDRAVGWYFVSLLETLQVFPQSHDGYARLLEYFTTLAAAVKKSQDTSGGWWLIMDEPYPGMEGNYIESSATAMFTTGMLQGIRLGFIAEDEYLAPAQKAYALMTEKYVVEKTDGTLDWEGTVSVGSLKGNATYEYYVSVPLATNDFKGVGPFMLASYEMESWAST
ncbi:unsaturated rhamnogalacturonan hydrolase [Pseudomassariella vexata]|uniref:Unsaturated rhamnogalacturonan hydrolase n=1 Tax=Pseudomassariella vexata TaxID=1141098 RepID=A0A1Y2EAD1_9PEZI|nr:unsaturated rhamnogalacturonan hydrolase [Pseudomassariella vexata]ORY68523.1 unsaturated rhamnogalacturonan hydrolase [Pseudomassariella vexata]